MENTIKSIREKYEKQLKEASEKHEKEKHKAEKLKTKMEEMQKDFQKKAQVWKEQEDGYKMLIEENADNPFIEKDQVVEGLEQ